MMTFAKFEKKFRTEEDCLDYLVRMRWPLGVECPRCGNAKVYKLAKPYRWQCKKCAKNGYRFSPIAGTIFGSTFTAEIPRQLLAEGVPNQLVDGFTRVDPAQQGELTNVGVDLGAQILGALPPEARDVVEPFIGQIVTGIHEAFSLAIASTMWLAVVAAIAAAAVVTLVVPELALRRSSGSATLWRGWVATSSQCWSRSHVVCWTKRSRSPIGCCRRCPLRSSSVSTRSRCRRVSALPSPNSIRPHHRSCATPTWRCTGPRRRASRGGSSTNQPCE